MNLSVCCVDVALNPLSSVNNSDVILEAAVLRGTVLVNKDLTGISELNRLVIECFY
jgi:hypothetical protein